MTIVSISSVLSVGLTVSAGETLEVLLGGSAVSPKVADGGTLEVSAGGFAGAAAVSSGASLVVVTGGSASGTGVLSGGAEYVSGGSATSTTISGGGSQVVTAGGVADDATVQSGGTQFVSATGSALGTTLSDGGKQSVGSGGLASATVVDLGARAFVLNGGIVSSATVNSGGEVFASSGGSATGTVLTKGGYAAAVSTGMLIGTTVGAGGTAFVSLGGIASTTTVAGGGAVSVGASGTASLVTIDAGGLLAVAGGTTSSATVSGEEVLSSGAVASRSTIGMGGVALVLSGGSAVSATVDSGGRLVVLGGGAATSTTTLTGGSVVSAAVVLQAPGTVSAWATSAAGATVGSGGTLFVVAGGTATGTGVTDGGSVVVQGGNTTGTTLADASETAESGGHVSSSTVGTGAVEHVSSGGTSFATRVTAGGVEVVSASGIASDTAIGAGGTVEVLFGGSAGGMSIDASGLMVLGSGGVAFDGIGFAGADATLEIGGTVMPTVPIAGFALSDVIDLPNLLVSNVTFAGINASDDLVISAVTSAGGASYALDLKLTGVAAGTPVTFAPDTDGGTKLSIPCFLAGTRIATPAGEVPVEALAPGDLVLTLAGAARPVRWVGFGRTLVTPRNREDATPVLIRRGALAEGVPRRDLRVTRGHALYLDGMLVPAGLLVNHRTIRWDDAAQVVEFYHLELDGHDVILAEGAAAESFLDDDNSPLFHNAATRPAAPPKQPCAPVLREQPAVAHIWHRLSARAGRPPAVLISDPNLHLLADGARLDAEAVAGGVWRFRLDAPARELRIVSRTAMPAMLGTGPDHRRLGVALRRIVLTGGGAPTVIPWDDARLAHGFHAAEPAARHRWTDGDARMPGGLSAGARIDLHVACRLPHYMLPAAAPRRAAAA